MVPLPTEHVRPLRDAETHLLQLLLSSFDLSLLQEPAGAELEVRFSDDTPAIWRRQAKQVIRAAIPDFERRAQDLQELLDEILIHRKRTHYTHDTHETEGDPGFLFRYVSGGALPVVRYHGADHYCLFFRDVDPIGWNIANGGSDSREELLDPLITVEREFREELMVVTTDPERHLVFAWDGGRRIDRPEYARARVLWDQAFSVERNILRWAEEKLVVTWVDGPDSLKLSMGEHERRRHTRLFLNINALDFGIEVDRIARFELPDNAMLLDGEINDGRLVKRPIGLFECGAFDKLLDENATTFLPDHLFYDAQTWPPASIVHVVCDRFLNRLVQEGIRAEDHRDALCESIRASNPQAGPQPFDLCPVTRRIVQRAKRREIEESPPTAAVSEPRGNPHVFISYARADAAGLADKLRDRLRDKGAVVWLDRYDLPAGEIASAIRRVLSRNDAVILILSAKALTSRWINLELAAVHDEAFRQGRHLLLPIALDHNWEQRPKGLVALRPELLEDLKRYNVIDFSGWETGEFESAFAKVWAGILRMTRPGA